MGMNYYVVSRKPSIDEPVHIGKSSMGWLFNFQVQNTTYMNTEIVWNTYNQVMDWLEEHTTGINSKFIILNEENERKTFKQFKSLVDKKQKDPHNLKNPDNFVHCRNVDGYRFSSGDFS